jgi:ferric-dicitrate binding protein FerR (iron transport regulator)
MKKEKTYREGNDERKWDVLAARLSGEEVPDQDQFNESGDDSSILTSEMWNRIENMKSGAVKPDVDNAWEKVYGRLVQEDLIPAVKPVRLTRSSALFIRIAASILILISAGYLTYHIVSSENQKMITATSGDSKNIQVNLPDGSRVTLNRKTTLTYPSQFDGSLRIVELNGEAYFEVESDLSRPFRVTAGNASIEVLGTSFNVNAEESKGEVEVFVTSGRVLLSSESEAEGIELTEGFIGRTTTGKTLREINDNPNYMAWNSGILVYESAGLETVFSDLKKVYGIEIEADDSVISDKLITTVLDNVKEEDIINIIATTFNLSWRKEGGVYIFSHF